MVASIADKLADDFRTHAVDLARLEEGVRQQVFGALKELERELVADLAAGDPTAALRTREQMSRAAALYRQTTKTIQTYYREASQALDEQLRDLANLEAEHVLKATNALVGVELFTGQLSPGLLRAIASNTLIEGAPSREWWSRQAGALKQRFEDQIRLGMLRGETLNELVQRVRGRSTGRRNAYWWKGKRRTYVEFSGGIMDIGTRQAEALVRTSVQAVSNAARLEMYDQNSDVINGYQALVTLDSRTSTICQARSGHAWDLDGNPIIGNEPFPGSPPWHYNCRSTLIPLTKSWEELSGKKGVPEIGPGTQKSMDGAVAGDLDYEGWLKTKPVAFQKEVLGPNRWQLWNGGKLNFGQLIDQKGTPRTVADLKAELGVWKPNVESLFPSPRTVRTFREVDENKYFDFSEQFFGERPTSYGAALPLLSKHHPAIRTYVGGTYMEINRMVRARGTSEAFRNESLEKVEKDIKGYLNRAPELRKDLLVYRGSRSSVSHKIGDTFSTKGFFSTSTDPVVANGFLPETGTERVLYEIVVRKGSKKVLTGFNIEEREVLFDSGAKFRVVGKKTVSVVPTLWNGKLDMADKIRREVYQLEYLDA